MRLSDVQKRILGTIELDADLSVGEVAQKTRLKPLTVQRTVRDLVEQGVIVGRTAVVDVSRIGLIEYGINFPFGTAAQGVRTSCIKSLLRNRSVSWIAEVGGDSDIMINFLARSPHHVAEFISKVSNEFPHAIEHKKICQRVDRMRFRRGYWSSRLNAQPRFVLSERLGSEDLNDIDRSILLALSDSVLESYRDLARTLGVPIATFLRRIEKLRERKILLGFGYRLNLELLGILQFRVHISLADTSDGTRKRLVSFCGKQPGVKVLIRCVGEWDYEMEIDAHTNSEMKGLLELLRQEFKSDLISCKAYPIFQQLKFISFPAL